MKVTNVERRINSNFQPEMEVTVVYELQTVVNDLPQKEADEMMGRLIREAFDEYEKTHNKVRLEEYK